MSKYTTEVRFICENKSGLEISGGSGDVDSIIANSWNKIFTSKAPFFDEEYRSILCQKILKHYYLREICCETVGIWTLWMNTRLEEIMPYYNQLYESAKIEFNPMHNVDLTSKHERNVEGTSKEDGTRTDNTTGKRTLTGNRDTDNTSVGTRNTTNSSDETKRDLYSDTPQGAITGLENENYLTNARKITDNVNGTGNEETNTTEKSGTDYSETEDTTGKIDGVTSNTGKTNTTEDYLETIIGKQGTESFSSLLNEFRETFLNIDMKVIEEFNDLFFGLW
jgi:hypothetical protein|nr:MAG TPA: Lower collar protein [Podoviridae sp. ctkBg18]